MFADLHAVLVLAGVVATLVAIVWSPAWRPRPVRQTLVAAVPIVVVGTLCRCLLSATGIPVAEWLFPLLGVILGGLFVENQRAFQVLRWSLLGLSILLCVNGMFLRTNGYASAVALPMYQAMDRSRLHVLEIKLQEEFAADRVLPRGSLAEMLEDPGIARWDRRTIERVWHTSFTGLYRIVATPSEVWYPGGPVATGSKQLEWKPSQP